MPRTFSEGSFGDSFYIIERGLVSVWRTSDEGVETRLVKLARGQYFGEAALVSNKPRNATVRAEMPLTLLSLEKKDFDRLVQQYLDLADQVDEHVRYNWLLRDMPIFEELDYTDLEDLSRLHFTAKTDLRDNYPYGLFAMPLRNIVRLKMTPANEGKPVVVGFTKHDVAMWQQLMVRLYPSWLCSLTGTLLPKPHSIPYGSPLSSVSSAGEPGSPPRNSWMPCQEPWSMQH